MAQIDALTLNLLLGLGANYGMPQQGPSTGRNLNPEPSTYEAPVLYGVIVLGICAKPVVAHFKVLDKHYSGETGEGPKTCTSAVRQLARSVV
jgi:hypothetical protein